MYQLELHFHTDESSRCGKVPAAEGVRMHIEQGYDGRIISAKMPLVGRMETGRRSAGIS